MNVGEMQAIVERHQKAEGAGDVEGAVAVYTDDVIHDAVGFPGSPRQGMEAARDFYRFLTANFRTDDEQALHQYATDDALVLEQLMTGTVIGEMLGLPGNGRSVSFRILHVFEFRDGLVSREQVWIDSAAIVQQLAAPGSPASRTSSSPPVTPSSAAACCEPAQRTATSPASERVG